MNFSAWQELSPAQAAHEVHHRVRRSFSPAQQRAAIAHLASVDEITARFAASPRHQPLGGVPYFAKDLFDVAGTVTLAGSTFLPEVRPSLPVDGAFAQALHQQGAVFVGKTQLHEFAYGVTGENPHYGDCEHPQFPGRTTGGSSSGSAAVVAAEITPFALGSDTGGSVRVPAAFCGLFGFRLTPGDPWIRDAFPLSPTFDTPGWFTRTAGDLQKTLAALVPSQPMARAPRGCYLEYGLLDPEVAAACGRAAAHLTRPADATTRAELETGFAPALEAYNTIVALEAWQTHHTWAANFRDRYDPQVWQRLNRVHTVSPEQGAAARGVLGNVRAFWAQFFSTYDFLVLPASPTPAPTKAACTPEIRTRILKITTPASLGGQPVLTIPVLLPSGLTTGLQIIARDPTSGVFSELLKHG